MLYLTNLNECMFCEIAPEFTVSLVFMFSTLILFLILIFNIRQAKIHSGASFS